MNGHHVAAMVAALYRGNTEAANRAAGYQAWANLDGHGRARMMDDIRTDIRAILDTIEQHPYLSPLEVGHYVEHPQQNRFVRVGPVGVAAGAFNPGAVGIVSGSGGVADYLRIAIDIGFDEGGHLFCAMHVAAERTLGRPLSIEDRRQASTRSGAISRRYDQIGANGAVHKLALLYRTEWGRPGMGNLLYGPDSFPYEEPWPQTLEAVIGHILEAQTAGLLRDDWMDWIVPFELGPLSSRIAAEVTWPDAPIDVVNEEAPGALAWRDEDGDYARPQAERREMHGPTYLVSVDGFSAGAVLGWDAERVLCVRTEADTGWPADRPDVPLCMEIVSQRHIIERLDHGAYLEGVPF